MDALREVLYGGHRSVDNTTSSSGSNASSTVLTRAYLPTDGHSWGKQLTGKLCKSGSGYGMSCSIYTDCNAADITSCVDVAALGKYLTPYGTATSPSVCSSTAIGTTTPGILVVRYQHPSSEGTGSVTNSASLVNSYAPTSIFQPVPTTSIPSGQPSGKSSSVYYTKGWDDATLNPCSDNYADNYNIFTVTSFTVPTGYGGNWTFGLDSDDAAEIQVSNSDGSNSSVVVGWYGGHGCSGGANQSGTIALTAGKTYTIVGRHFEQSGDEGIAIYFKPPGGSSFKALNQTNLSSALGLVNGSTPLSAPLIASGNECAIESVDFINTGIPSAGKTVVTGTAHQHLFCNVSLSDGGVPLMRVMQNMVNPASDWFAKERPECNDPDFGGNYPFGSTYPDDYAVNVQVCNSSFPESDCTSYGSGSSATLKPTGLLQKYSWGDGSTVCSKSFQPCTMGQSGTCGTNNANGVCIYNASMYFGMISGSYTKNHSGGVLRKNFSTMRDEINPTTGQFYAIGAADGIINTYESLKILAYNYGDYTYDDDCGWYETGPIPEGMCYNWGNPMAELFYEALRYISGKGSPTSAFTYTSNNTKDGYLDSTNSGLQLPHPTWGFLADNSSYLQPYDVFPLCAQPFIMMLSEINPNYDGNSLPGSTYATGISEDAGLPHLGTGDLSSSFVSTSGETLLNYLADTISGNELTGSNYFIGRSGTTYDNICTSKSVSGFSTINGLCPEEPTKQGTYYTSALAYYGNILFNKYTNSNSTANGTNGKYAGGIPNVSTYAVALSSPYANLTLNIGGQTVTFEPVGKSVSGCDGVYSQCYQNCSNVTFTTSGGLNFNNSCNANSFCPTNQIVNFMMDDVSYDSSGNLIYAKFRANYEDSEQGADYDMDAIVGYELCTQAANQASLGNCTTSLTSSQLQINATTIYGAGCIDQILGFNISGTNADGLYLVLKDGDVPSAGASSTTPNVIANMPLSWSKIFTTSNSPAAGFLHDPLWYAAKWGGFNDLNKTGIPSSVNEWATKNGVTPDNYFLVTNPLQLQSQLDSALNSVLTRVSSGTASSILNNSQGSGANLLQAVFYPSKTFDNNSSASWIGEVQNLWYYLDPFFNSSTVRVDTNSDYSLDLQSDYIAHFRFDTTQSQTVVDLIHDVNGNGNNLVSIGTYNTDDPNVKSLWRAGKLLWQRNLTSDPRNVYTVTSSTAGAPLSSFVANGSFNADPTVLTLLQANSATNPSAYAAAIINYTLGTDQPSSGFRPRQVTMLNCGLTDSEGCTREWKLGDIINSTPKLESTIELQNYDQASPNGYGDSSYSSFTASTNYQQHEMAYVGSNDGMLHAFKLGILDVTGQTATHKATLRNVDGTVASIASNLGREEWAFIPRNALPYLAYLADPAYSHLFTVDLTSTLVDASINIPAIPAPSGGCDSTHYWLCKKQTATLSGNNLDMTNTSWRTVLIGGMGAGGASQNLFQSDGVTANPCIDQIAGGTCVKTPINNVGYSSYFALDVTNPDTLPGGTNPVKFMWEFNGDPTNGNYLGYATTGPAIVRIGSAGLNGRWFAVFGSGPTGPIDVPTHAFQGTSNQNLKLFVVDLATGALVRTIDTGITNAFAGSLSNAVIDVDKWNSQSTGFYSDDAIYVGYVQQDTTAGTWTKGGVLRVMTKQNTDPTQWVTSTVINGIGPVTTSVTKLQDRNATYPTTHSGAATGKLWLYFGTGRYYYKSDALSNQFTLYGIQDPCYSSNTESSSFTAVGPTNTFDLSGTTSSCNTIMTESNLQNQTGTASSAPSTSLSSSAAGWYIRLDASGLNSGYSSERVITNPVASTAGAVFFTTFMPTSNICGYGGNSNIWGVKYDTGAAPPAAAIQGKALMQVSTGALAEISLSSAFSGQSNLIYNNRRTATATSGMPPSSSGLALVVGPKPTKKILHYQEK
jgi:type IV pilus assembly protein PilY1